MASILNAASELVLTVDLNRHPRNPRRGDTARIAQSIQDNGFYGALIVQRSTNYVLAGNHRLDAALDLGMVEVPVIFVNVDDARAERILVADNKTSDAAAYDDTALLAVLRDLESTEDGLSGTAYTEDELAEVVKRVARDTNEAFEGGAGEAGASSSPVAPTENEAGEKLFQVAYYLTREERQGVLDAIRVAQGKWDLTAGKDAMISICRWFSDTAAEASQDQE